jgi:hypothetical protein
VHPPPQFFFDFQQLRLHAVPAGSPTEQEFPLARFAADESEAEEREGFRFAKAALRASLSRITAELEQAGLIRVQRQRELPQSFAHRVPEALGVSFTLEADHNIDDSSSAMAPMMVNMARPIGLSVSI